MSGSPTLSDIGIEHHELKARDRELARQQRELHAANAARAAAPQPVEHSDRTQNELRPSRLSEVIGQEEAVELLGEFIATAKARSEPLDHGLLVGPAGTGKTTLANVIANELGRRCFQLAAPVPLDTLLQLAEVMRDGDVLFVDEIHQQAVMERRGKEAVSSPEVFLSLLEDFVIATQSGMVPFPKITVIGATTDPGRLPDPFLDRFPIQPVLHPYSERALATIAEGSARRLGLTLMPGVAEMFAAAARRTPRVLNNYIRNADNLAVDRYVVEPIAERVLFKLNGVTSDGLTRHMQAMLLFLYEKCKRTIAATGEVRYQGSVNTIATGIGLSRDTKAIQLRVEPWLIQAGYVQLGSGGRLLTPEGIWRARQLQEGT